MDVLPHEHPMLRCLAAIDDRLDDMTSLDPTFLPTADKERALVAVDRELARLEGLRMQLLASAADVADETGARSAGSWLAHVSRHDARDGVRDQRAAETIARWEGVSLALRGGRINAVQALTIARALDALPDALDHELVAKAEDRLLADAGHVGPRELRVLGRRVLEVVAPDVADAEEERQLLGEERRAREGARLTFRPRGDGVTDVVARVPDHVAQRLRAYLDSFTSPRRAGIHPPRDVDLVPLPRRRAEAFGAMLEHLPTEGLPMHGGTATSVMVMLDLDTLRRDLGAASVSTGGRMSVSEARRLAGSAGVHPVVLGGAGEVLDLGRARRLFSPAQRKALAVRDRRCREEGCDIPAAWCEAHHATTPWSRGGRTDLRDGVLLCSFHHHRAHDRRWGSDRLANGDVRFTRRT